MLYPSENPLNKLLALSKPDPAAAGNNSFDIDTTHASLRETQNH